MAGMSAVQFKIMPTAPDVDLTALKEKAEALIAEMGGVAGGSEEQPIAFGLKALILSFAYPEDKEIDEVGNKLTDIDNVSSADMIDYRRAIG